MGPKNFEMQFPLQIAAECYQASPEISFSTVVTKILFWSFWNFEFIIFNEFLKFNIGPYGETKNLHYLENEQL